MSPERKLASVVAKFRSHPQFLGVEIDTSNPNQSGAMGDTLLHFAVEAGTLEDIEVLLAAGANVNAIGDIGNTPLHSAAMRGHNLAAKKLLDFGADPMIKNEFGETPADVARLGGHHDLVAVLKAGRTR